VYKRVEDPNTLFLYPEKGSSNSGTFLGNYVTKTGIFTLTTKRTSNTIQRFFSNFSENDVNDVITFFVYPALGKM